MNLKLSCPRCSSNQVVPGEAKGDNDELGRTHAPTFVPDANRFKWTLTSPVIDIETSSCVCTACGPFWSEVDKKKLAEIVVKFELLTKPEE